MNFQDLIQLSQMVSANIRLLWANPKPSGVLCYIALRGRQLERFQKS